ncbi:phosphatase PAP2 family protein [Nocardioides pocheonensis]|uniref:Phosphatase PAP2 family protein n=1 Tax=Nocardioides pocheonensis TaxID=661485 RepID=A0A3N0GF61_9ACTN|nr:phosphatase PAP2 family protein [Nocardioides pocheonensis]RNM11097.1 phosphatase PAP2 family protein [Nocardioides pocheonensis]
MTWAPPTLRERRTASDRAAVLPELGFVAAALVCYLAVRWYTLDRTPEAVRHTAAVLRLERLLHLDVEHRFQDAALSVPGLGTFLTQFYVWGYFPALIVIVVWMYRRHPPAYRRLRTALLVSGVAGLLVYATYPTAPPWIGGTGFTDTVAHGSFEGVARPHGLTNHLGAVPSFHVGWVVLVAVVVLPLLRSPVLRVLCVLHPVLMACAVVATGNHWVLDLPAGLALAALGLAGARAVSRVAAGVC